MKLLLASTSPIKVAAVNRVFPDAELGTINCEDCKLPEQPLDCGDLCARVRLRYAKENMKSSVCEFFISIENSVDTIMTAPNRGKNIDRCHVLIERKGLFGYSTGGIGYPVDPSIMAKLLSGTTDSFSSVAGTKRIRGLTHTVGDIYHELDNKIDPKNWVKTIHQSDRIDQITASITAAWVDLQEKLVIARKLISSYQVYEDYPKPGVIFEDFFAVIRERVMLQDLIRLVYSQCCLDDFDYVVGPESRGFFGFGLSCVGGYGFIPVRKQGKLPGNCLSVSYSKEYGSDTLEIHDDIPQGTRVLVFDDMIGTGGSLRAVRDLLETAGCVVVNYVVLREVPSLRKTAAQTLGKPYTVLLQD